MPTILVPYPPHLSLSIAHHRASMLVAAEQYHVSLYLEDAVKLLLDSRDERPLEFMAEYFNTMQRGDHVLLREFSYCNATPYNRCCLMRRAWDALKAFDGQRPVSAADMCQLLGLLCPDFSLDLVHEAARLTEPVPDVEGRPPRYEAARVLVHLRFLFYFAEFLKAPLDPNPILAVANTSLVSVSRL